MAQSEHLPIYKASCDLCLYMEQVVAKFARQHRYALGAELREGARRCCGSSCVPTHGATSFAIATTCVMACSKALKLANAHVMGDRVTTL